MRLLRWAVQTGTRYVGMIGSKRKVIAIHHGLREEGLAENLFDHVYAPIGLDIGALTPEEIGVAVCAEMIAVRRRSESNSPHELVSCAGRKQRTTLRFALLMKKFPDDPCP